MAENLLLVVRVTGTGLRDIDDSLPCECCRPSHHDLAQLLHEALLNCDRELPATPHASIKIHGLISDDEELLSCSKGPGEWSPAGVGAETNLHRNDFRIGCLHQGEGTDPNVWLCGPGRKGCSHRFDELVKVLRPGMADEDVHLQQIVTVEDVRIWFV